MYKGINANFFSGRFSTTCPEVKFVNAVTAGGNVKFLPAVYFSRKKAIKGQNTFYHDFIYNQKMPKLLIFDVFTLLICEKNIANYTVLRCKTFSLKFFDKYHVWIYLEGTYFNFFLCFIFNRSIGSAPKKNNINI